ncbi:MAG: Smr/MutS family protein [Rhodospirillaceae bacterium]
MARSFRSPTAEEMALWRASMRDAVPFRRAAEAEAVPPPPLSRPPSPMPAAAAPARPSPPARHRQPPLEPGRSAGLDRRTDERLRRGQLPIEARIDLHGLTQPAAFDALYRFVIASHAGGRRCVLVITGKGPVSQGGGVLRSMVPRWLAEPTLRRRIIALHRAQPRDGGDGALYVLLKRQRPE